MSGAVARERFSSVPSFRTFLSPGTFIHGTRAGMSQPQPELEEDTYGEAEALEYPSHTAATAGIRYLGLTYVCM